MSRWRMQPKIGGTRWECGEMFSLGMLCPFAADPPPARQVLHLQVMDQGPAQLTRKQASLLYNTVAGNAMDSIDLGFRVTPPLQWAFDSGWQRRPDPRSWGGRREGHQLSTPPSPLCRKGPTCLSTVTRASGAQATSLWGNPSPPPPLAPPRP